MPLDLPSLLSNDMLIAFVGAMLLGSFLYALRTLFSQLTRLARFQLTTTLRVTNTVNDPTFDAITVWLSQSPYAQRARRLSTVGISPDRTDDTDEMHAVTGLGPGLHILFYARRPLFLQYEEGDRDNRGHIHRTYTLTMPGRDPSRMRSLIRDAHAAKGTTKEPGLFEHTYMWARQTSVHKRDPDALILPDGTKESLLADMRWFLDAQDWYRERGIPYRRGYLFHGVPGTGKSSTALALASSLRIPLCVLNPSSIENDREFSAAIKEAPFGIILIEDIDSFFSERARTTNSEESGGGGPTFSGILNTLDGVTAPEGRILILTTNHADALDPALIRPGRIDRKVEFSEATYDMVERMHTRFFPDAPHDARTKFAHAYAGRTPAEVQEQLVRLSFSKEPLQ